MSTPAVFTHSLQSKAFHLKMLPVLHGCLLFPAAGARFSPAANQHESTSSQSFAALHQQKRTIAFCQFTLDLKIWPAIFNV